MLVQWAATVTAKCWRLAVINDQGLNVKQPMHRASQLAIACLSSLLTITTLAGGNPPKSTADDVLEPAAPEAIASNAEHTLSEKLSAIQSLQATFKQQQIAADGYVIRSTEGQMQLQRPGKMRWVSAPPYEQSVITNGEQLWIYDPDLEQVTIHRLDNQSGSSPILLLTGDSQQLANDYYIEQRESRYTLTPKQGNGAYQQVAIEFVDQLPTVIDVTDSLGERTLIELSDLLANPAINAELFEFTPPEGVDILHND